MSGRTGGQHVLPPQGRAPQGPSWGEDGQFFSLGVSGVRPPFRTVEQLAAALGVRPGTVYEWTRGVGPQSIPRYRVGRRLMFDLNEVVAWIKRTKDCRALPGGRARRVLPAGRRRAPERQSGGRKAANAVRTHLSANGPAAGALEVPSHDANGT
jgi:excisionase family DNA binding protein